MPTFRLFYCVTFVFLMLGGCKSDKTLSPNEAKSIREDVINTLKQYHQDINNEGALAEIKYLDSTKDFSWLAPGFNSPLGYDSVVSILKTMDSLYSRIEHSWDTLTVLPQSKSEALYEGIITSTLTTINGDTATMKLKEEGVAVKREGGWKLLTGKTRLLH